MNLKNIFKASTLAAALGLALAGPAQAGTATGNITIAGQVVATCTVSSPTVTFSNVPIGSAAQSLPVAIDVNCPATVTWALSSPMNQPITIGTDTTSNTGELLNAAGTSGYPVGTPLTGTGIGSAQTQNLTVKIMGPAAGNLVSYGTISGTLPVTLAY